MLNVVVMVSGGGTNLQAIIDAVEAGTITNTRLAGVISNNKNAYALERAAKHGIPTACVSPKDFENRGQFNQKLLETVDGFEPDLVVLAGFLVVIPPEMTAKYRNRMINIHPSLIPSFCGTGYYGLRVHEAALAEGEGGRRHGAFCRRGHGYRADHPAEGGGGAAGRYSQGAAAQGHGAGGVEDPATGH